MPSPAILVRAGSVPSSFGPLGLLSAAATPAATSTASTTTPGKTSTFFIHFLLARSRTQRISLALTRHTRKGFAPAYLSPTDLSHGKHCAPHNFTPRWANPKLNGTIMNSFCRRVSKCAALFGWSLFFIAGNALAQAVPETAKEKPAAVSQEKPPEPPNAAQIELLETKYRFEENGDSRKEVHALVKINSELGVRQFARLNFDYNRSFQSVEIPLVHITHASGGTADILPSAIADVANPAVEKFPAYQDVRVKSVRILGLQPGDSLEYRVITTTTKHPLAPDFWLEHAFDRSGEVLEERYQLDLPSSRFEESEKDRAARLELKAKVESSPAIPPWQKADPAELFPPRIGKIYVSPDSPQGSNERVAERNAIRLHYNWKSVRGETQQRSVGTQNTEISDPDIVVTTYFAWEAAASALDSLCYQKGAWTQPVDQELFKRRKEILAARKSESVSIPQAIFEYISSKIATVDLPLEANGFKSRPPSEILESEYGTPTDKARLLVALIREAGAYNWQDAQCGVVSKSENWKMLQLPRPSLFSQLLIRAYVDRNWM